MTRVQLLSDTRNHCRGAISVSPVSLMKSLIIIHSAELTEHYRKYKYIWVYYKSRNRGNCLLITVRLCLMSILLVWSFMCVNYWSSRWKLMMSEQRDGNWSWFSIISSLSSDVTQLISERPAMTDTPVIFILSSIPSFSPFLFLLWLLSVTM